MIRKGKIDKMDITNKKATVVFEDLDDSVSAQLPTLNGQTFLIGQLVTVVFFSDDISDGVVIGKIGG